MSKNIKITISGVGNDPYHDGQLQCDYIYASSNKDHTSVGKVNYDAAMTTYRSEYPIVLDFVTNEEYSVTPLEGINANDSGGNYFSIYRREYQIFERTNVRYNASTNSNEVNVERKTYQGEWEPVVVNTTQSSIRDFNIASGHSYQYILYPQNEQNVQQFANATDEGDYSGKGKPVPVKWDSWSIAELIPMENAVDAPIVKKTYKVDLNNVWLFKYSLETGSQTQNFSKQDINTLGRFPQMGYGKQNFVSGEVSCLLGSEIVPYTSEGYIERTRASIRAPLSTNEKIFMLKQWRKFAFSPNPKLLQDIKGQNWIVQVVSSNNSPKNFYRDQPDTISFSWKQIDDTANIVVYGDGTSLPEPGKCDSVWHKV